MFSIREFIRFIKEPDIKPKKWKKIFYSYLKSADFYGWLFNPSRDQLSDYSGLLDDIYGSLTEDPDKLRMVISVVKDCPEEFGRATSAFLYSIAEYAMDVANNAFRNVDESYKSGKINRSEAKAKNDKISEYGDLINELNEVLIDIIKPDAKKLAKKTGLPKAITKMTLKQIPDPVFIDNNKVGVYLNMILGNIYSDIDKRDTDIEDIEWKEYFDEVFGSSNRYEVASFVLLESPNHIENFNSKSVRLVWDSLTSWALSTLEKCDDGTRGHMVELYIKRLAKAMDSNDTSVRVDLRSISSKEYPKLTRTVDKHKSEFDELFKPIGKALLKK